SSLPRHGADMPSLQETGERTAVILTLLFMVSCVPPTGLSGTVDGKELPTLTITPSSSTLTAIGATVQLVATARLTTGPVYAGRIIWFSSDTSIARVDD